MYQFVPTSPTSSPVVAMKTSVRFGAGPALIARAISITDCRARCVVVGAVVDGVRRPGGRHGDAEVIVVRVDENDVAPERGVGASGMMPTTLPPSAGRLDELHGAANRLAEHALRRAGERRAEQYLGGVRRELTRSPAAPLCAGDSRLGPSRTRCRCASPPTRCAAKVGRPRSSRRRPRSASAAPSAPPPPRPRPPPPPPPPPRRPPRAADRLACSRQLAGAGACRPRPPPQLRGRRRRGA